jgi:subtilase family serine protease
MNLARPAATVAGLSLLLGAVLSASIGSPAQATAGQAAPPSAQVQPALVRAGARDDPAPTTAWCEHNLKLACYQAWQLEQAYNLPALYARHLTGAGQTIVIVDPYGSPTLTHDLGVFDQAEHLPAPPSMKVIEPVGKVAPYKPTNLRQSWATTTEVSVEVAHAIAPDANILVAETPTNEIEGASGFPQIVKAEEYVVKHHLGGVISQDFNTPEQDFATPQELLSLDGAFVDAARSGVTVLGATSLYGVTGLADNNVSFFLHRVSSWPDSDPLVTAVGATQLHLNAAGDQVRPATVFNDSYFVPINELFGLGKGPSPLASGGGESDIFARPGYQNGVAKVVGGQRGTPDISVSGACNGAFVMYQSVRGPLPAGWYPECGPGVSAPEFAGIVALAEQMAGHSLGLINPFLYELAAHHAPGIVDVTSGNNTVAFHQDGKLYTVKGFKAGPGYNLATGLGTIDAPYFVPELACLASHHGWGWGRLAATPVCRAS